MGGLSVAPAGFRPFKNYVLDTGVTSVENDGDVKGVLAADNHRYVILFELAKFYLVLLSGQQFR